MTRHSSQRRRRADTRRATRSCARGQVALACHVNPDGDALGSMLALHHVLRGAGRRLDRVLLGAVRRRAALPRAARPRAAHAARPVPARPRRDGHVRLRFARSPRRPRSERQGRGRAHRRRPPRFEPALRHDQRDRSRAPRRAACSCGASSACLGFPLTRDAAVCLYAALVCDTGRFQYESTTPEVFDLARELVGLRPADRPPVPDAVRGAPVRVPAAARRRARPRASSSPSKRFVWAQVTQADLARHGVTFEEVEGLIDIVRRTREAEVACVLKEAPDGTWRVSLRSLGDVDVCRIAEQQGGGGHRFAAGFTSDDPADAVDRQDPRRPLSGRASSGLHLGNRSSGRARRAGGRRQAGGVDVARRRREAAQGLRAAAGRARGHARSRRHRRAARRPRARHPADAVPAGDHQAVHAAGSCSASPPTRSTPRARCSNGRRCRCRASRSSTRRRRSSARSSRCRRWSRRSRSAAARSTSSRGRARRSSGRPRTVRIDRARRSRSSSPAPYPGGHRHASSARAAPTSVRSRPTSASRSAAARTSATLRRLARRFVRHRRGAHARSDRGRARRGACSRRATRCATSKPVVVGGEEVRAIAHGATFAARTLLPDDAGEGPFAVLDEHDAAARRLRTARRGREAGGRAGDGRVVKVYRDLARRARASGPARGHDRRVRRRAPRPSSRPPARARPRARARPVVDGAHLRPPSRPKSCGPSRRRAVLTTLEQKLELLEATDTVDECVVLTFDEARSKETAEEFVSEVLASALHARLVVVGVRLPLRLPPSRRRAAAATHGRRARVRGPRPRPRRIADGTTRRQRLPYSSTRVRTLLVAGDVAGAATILGRPHEVRGTVERGDARGRELGFPTANVAVPERICLPADGVYAGTFTGADGIERTAAISLGPAPDVLRRGRAPAARGVRPRLRRRPLRSGRRASGSATTCAARSGSPRSTP